MAFLTRLLLTLGLLTPLLAPVSAPAQDLFSPAITVNDSVVTQFEIDQRIKLLTLFRTAGDLNRVARTQLVEDRLKLEALTRAGMSLSDEALAQSISEFAGNANLTTEQFNDVLSQNGVEFETLRDYVRVGVMWRDYIRRRYGSRVTVTDADIDQALGQAGESGASIQVLLSEIIIPAPPPQAEAAMEAARRIANLTTQAEFSAAAREVSALPSKDNGGRLDWVPITNFPPALRGIFLALGPDQISAPLPITNGIALFQMRGIREVAGRAPEPALIDYATFLIPGGNSAEARAEAARISATIDVCDDLYGIAKGLPEDRLTRESAAPSALPQDLALELARLDPGEVSSALTTSDGQWLRLVMLCARTSVPDAEVDRDALRSQIIGDRLGGQANALLADLRSTATIIGE